MIVPLGLGPRRAPVPWQSRASILLAAAVLLLLLGALRQLSTEPAAGLWLALPSIRSLSVPSLRSLWTPPGGRPATSTTGATLSLKSVETAQMAAGEALLAWAGSLQNVTASVSNGNDSPLLPVDGGPLHYVWDARPAGAPTAATTETTSTCERVDESGRCLVRTQDVGRPVPLAEATPTTLNVQLAPHCAQDFVDEWAGSEIATLMTYIFTMSGVDPRVREWFPMATFEGTALRMDMGATRMAFQASNLTLDRIDPLALKVGRCYDHLEWWRAQAVPVQLATARTPDGLQILVTNLRTRVRFTWHVYEPSPFGDVTLADGEALIDVSGLLVVDVDLHDPSHAVEGCSGKFEFNDVYFTGPAVSSALFGEIISGSFPAFVEQVPELICYGRAKKEPDGYLDAVGGLRASFTLIGPPPKENSTDALAVGFTGIVPAVNALVAHWLSPLRPVLRQELLWKHDTAGLLVQARRDQTRLEEVGVHVPFGRGRFSHIQMPPPLPPSQPTLPATKHAQHRSWWPSVMPGAGTTLESSIISV